MTSLRGPASPLGGAGRALLSLDLLWGLLALLLLGVKLGFLLRLLSPRCPISICSHRTTGSMSLGQLVAGQGAQMFSIPRPALLYMPPSGQLGPPGSLLKKATDQSYGGTGARGVCSMCPQKQETEPRSAALGLAASLLPQLTATPPRRSGELQTTGELC